MKLHREFYNRDTLQVSKELLGKVLVVNNNNILCKGKIVEVEAYMGPMDKAAHSYNNRRTKRTEIMYGKPGFSYVYFIYGLYYCMNVVTREEGVPQAVLIRAVEPIAGFEDMSLRRFKKAYSELSNREKINITNGPSKLCSAMGIGRELNGLDLLGDIIYIEDGKEENFKMVTAKRVGIDYAEEAKDYPWRFYIEDNKYVSKK